MSALIGIALNLDEGVWKHGRQIHYLDAAYARAVGEAGGSAIYLPHPGCDPALFERLDGLLLPGGDDFLPEKPYPEGVAFEAAAAEKVAFDRSLLSRALERRIPVLGVCYGMQLLALQRGGSLHHHLPVDLPGAGEHSFRQPGDRHDLALRPDSKLAALLGATRASVNSRHHQAVDHPGDGLRICARADDGVVEAIESPEEAFLLGVQWHPESLEPAHRAAIFGAFVAACEKGPGKRA